MTTILAPSYATLDGFELSALHDNGVMVVLEEVDNWGASDVTLSVVQNPRANGGWAGDSFSTALPIGLSGTIVAPTAELATSTLDALIAAAAKTPVTLTFHVGAVSRSMVVRRDSGVMAKRLGETAIAWAVTMTAVDPRKYGAAITGTTGLPATSGGLMVPFTVPFTIASSVVSGNVTLTNLGNTSAPVTLRLDGPLPGGCVVTHVTSGTALSFATSLPLAAGAFLTVDMEKRIVLENGNASRNGYVTARNWFGCDPGVNVYAFSAPSAAAGTLTVSSFSAWD